MRVVLIDDEPMALVVLRELLSVYHDVDIVGAYTDAQEALNCIDKTKPDVIFLDIEMGSIRGLEIASKLANDVKNIEIVFVTAYTQYALDAFELDVIDYLQKPVQEARMRKTIYRLREKIDIATPVITNNLKLICFGNLQILDNNGKLMTWRTQKAKEIFVYLWYKNSAVSKDIIINDIFPDKNMEKAIALLHTTIYQLRKSLEKLGYLNGIEYFNESYSLNVPIKSDYFELKYILEKKEHNEEDIEKIISVYNGDFLEKEEYIWAVENRQRYAQKVSELLGKYVAKNLKKEEVTNDIKLLLDNLLKIDPYNENAAKMKIIYYGKTGNRAELQKFYKAFVKTLLEELEITPDKTTIALYNKYMRY